MRHTLAYADAIEHHRPVRRAGVRWPAPVDVARRPRRDLQTPPRDAFDFFAAEVLGLDVLRAAGGLRVPQVYAQGNDWLLLDDLGAAAPHPHFARLAGEGLVRQHRVRSERVGFDHDGYIGDSQ